MKKLNSITTNRRDVLKALAVGSTVGVFSLFDNPKVRAETYETPSYQK